MVVESELWVIWISGVGISQVLISIEIMFIHGVIFAKFFSANCVILVSLFPKRYQSFVFASRYYFLIWGIHRSTIQFIILGILGHINFWLFLPFFGLLVYCSCCLLLYTYLYLLFFYLLQPVHKWMVRHIYCPCLQNGLPKVFSCNQVVSKMNSLWMHWMVFQVLGS